MVAPAKSEIVLSIILGTVILVIWNIITIKTEKRIGVLSSILGENLPDHIDTPNVKFKIDEVAKYIIAISNPKSP